MITLKTRRRGARMGLCALSLLAASWLPGAIDTATAADVIYQGGLGRVLDSEAYTSGFVDRHPMLPGQKVMIDDWYVDVTLGYTGVQTNDSFGTRSFPPGGVSVTNTVRWDGQCWWDFRFHAICGGSSSGWWQFGTKVFMGPLGQWQVEVLNNGAVIATDTFELVPYAMARSGGDAQAIPPSTSTPVPLAVWLSYPDGRPAASKNVVFAITANPNKGRKPSGGLRTPSSSAPSVAQTLNVNTEDDGNARVLLDVGPSAGTYRLQATSVVAPGVVVPFTVTVSGTDVLDGVALAPKNLGDPADARSGCVGAPPAGAVQANTPNPINIGTGNKYRVETDYQGPGPFPLAFARYYNSFAASPGSLGAHWRGSYDRSVSVGTVTPAKGKQVVTTVAKVARPDGKVFSFTLTSGGWVGEPDVQDTLQSLPGGGFSYTCATDVVETFDSAGRLVGVAARGGSFAQQLAYDAQGRLDRVSDAFGRTMRFSYDAAGRLAGFVDAAGRPYVYAYDARGNLVSVRYVDGAQRAYLYENPQWPDALTGIVDERGVRHASFGYDAQGRAVLSTLAEGAGAVRVDYYVDGSRTVTDGRGAARRYGFELIQGVPRRTSLTNGACDSCGSATTRTAYDANGRVTAFSDYKGTQTTYVRDARGLETSRTEAAGTALARTITTSWHPVYRLPLAVVEPGRSTAFEYDSAGRLLSRSETDTASGSTRRWRYAYTASGLPAGVDGPRSDVNDVTTLAYDAAGNLVSLTDGLGRVTRHGGHDADGHPSSIVDANGLVITLGYDSRGRLASRSAGGLTTTWTHDAAGLLTRMAFPDGSAQSFAYDGAQRLVAVVDQLGNHIALTRDANGNLLRQETKDAGGTTVQLRRWTYDAMNQRVDDLDAQGRSDLRRNYDLNGNLVATFDPFNAVTRYGYDALDRMVAVTDAMGGTTAMSFDALDQLRGAVDPRGVATSYQVDGLGRRTQEASADSGTSTRAFDEAGQVVQRSWANGRRVSYSHDALNRLTAADDGAGGAVRYGYDELSGSNFGVGRMTQMTDSSGSTRWRYDQLGRLVQTVQTVGALTQATSRGYDTGGRLQQLVYPSGRQVSFGHSHGQLRTIAVDGVVQITDITWRPFGGPRQWFQGGAWRQRVHDLDGRLVSYPLGSGNRTLEHDEKNRIVGSGARRYGYDALDRLVSDGGTSYGYDANGNRTSKTVPAGASSYAYVAGSNRLASVSGSQARTYSHDAAGNVVSDGGHALRYDGHNRMAGVDTSVSYLINGLGQRVGKLAGGVLTTYVYDEQGRLLGEYDANGTPLQETVYLGDTPVMVIKPTGVFFVDADQIDAPRLIRDASNQPVWSWDADAFGEALPDEDPQRRGTQFIYNLRMPGQVFDRETGWFYNWHRYYEPPTGRYAQGDPIGLDGGLNLYGYVEGNPLLRVDPYGLFGMDEVWAGLYGGTGGWSPSQGAVDAWAGFGDGVSLGISKRIRDWQGIGGVNRCSALYRGGDFAGSLMAPLGRFAYITRVGRIGVNGARNIAEAAALTAERNAMKRYFRGPFASLFWDYKSEAWAARNFVRRGAEQFASSAGKSNPGFNGLAGYGLLNAIRNQVVADEECTCER